MRDMSFTDYLAYEFKWKEKQRNKNLIPLGHKCTECKYFQLEILNSGRCKKFYNRLVDDRVYCDSWEGKTE